MGVVDEEPPAGKMLTEQEAYVFAIQQVDFAVVDMASQIAIHRLSVIQEAPATIRGLLKMREMLGLDNAMYRQEPAPTASEE